MSIGLWWLPGSLALVALFIHALGQWAYSGGKNGPPLRRGWVCGVVGLRGGGKSLFVNRLIAQRMHAGATIVANFPVQVLPGSKSEFHRMVTWWDVCLAPAGSMVVLDEAHQWAEAVAGRSLDPTAQWYVSHARKLGHEVWWIAQDETQVSSKVRAQTNEMVECREWMPGHHIAKAYSPRTFRKAKAKALWSWRYKPKGAATRIYDTMELVRPVEQEKLDRSAWVRQMNAVIDEIYRRRGLLDVPELDPLELRPGSRAA